MNQARLAKAAKGAVVLHPGPINRGLEIASDLADAPESLTGAALRSRIGD